MDLQLDPQQGYQKKLLFRSVTVYNKKLSSQCDVSAQIEQVQDKSNLVRTTSRSWNNLHLVRAKPKYTRDEHDTL